MLYGESEPLTSYTAAENAICCLDIIKHHTLT
jgi:hypothetical protein